jgi:protein SCO1/2
MDENHRMLRAVEGNDALRAYFELGVNFNGSLVNRHRIELYILDAAGRIAVSFERLHWDEDKIVSCAIETLKEKGCGSSIQA